MSQSKSIAYSELEQELRQCRQKSKRRRRELRRLHKRVALLLTALHAAGKYPAVCANCHNIFWRLDETKQVTDGT
jgi:hypothetical protein